MTEKPPDVLERMMEPKDCARCDAILVGDPVLYKVEIRVGAAHRWNLSLCAPCREWLNECIRRSMDYRPPDKGSDDGPRQITLP
jgi:hypothetical protein